MAERVSLEARISSRIFVHPETGCHVWLGYRNDDGYGEVKVDRVKLKVHRVTYALYVGDLEPGMVVDHLCRNRACCNPAHLEQITSAENTRRGDVAVVSPELAANIKARLADGYVPAALAAEFGVSATTIRRVERGQHWTSGFLCPPHA